MKKLKLKKIKAPSLNKSLLKRNKSVEQRVNEAISEVPRITNDTVANHREDVLSTARKYIYPLQHSKHSIVRISAALLVAVLIFFLASTGLALYEFQDTSSYTYDITKILPLPVAKVGNNWVSYESYLFELRRNMHYYSTQQQTNFSNKDGKAQLKRLKEQAMTSVVQSTLIVKQAKQNNVAVSSQLIDDQVNILRQENRLGSSDKVLREVLSQYWGWTEVDFKRELKTQLLQSQLVAKLDTVASKKAHDASVKLNSGGDFAAIVATTSDDTSTKLNGGQYPNPITINDPQISPTITYYLFKLNTGQISGIINTGYTLEIIKLISKTGNTVHAAHIQINLNDISYYLKPELNNLKVQKYIKI